MEPSEITKYEWLGPGVWNISGVCWFLLLPQTETFILQILHALGKRHHHSFPWQDITNVLVLVVLILVLLVLYILQAGPYGMMYMPFWAWPNSSAGLMAPNLEWTALLQVAHLLLHMSHSPNQIFESCNISSYELWKKNYYLQKWSKIFNTSPSQSVRAAPHALGIALIHKHSVAHFKGSVIDSHLSSNIPLSHIRNVMYRHKPITIATMLHFHWCLFASPLSAMRFFFINACPLDRASCDPNCPAWLIPHFLPLYCSMPIYFSEHLCHHKDHMAMHGTSVGGGQDSRWVEADNMVHSMAHSYHN